MYYCQWVSPVWEAWLAPGPSFNHYNLLNLVWLSLSVSAASTALVCFTSPSLFFSCLPFCPAIFSWLSGSNLTIRRRKKKLLKQKSLLQEKFKCHVLNQLLLMCLVNWVPVFYFTKAAGSAGLRFLIFPSVPKGEQGQKFISAQWITVVSKELTLLSSSIRQLSRHQEGMTDVKLLQGCHPTYFLPFVTNAGTDTLFSLLNIHIKSTLVTVISCLALS